MYVYVYIEKPKWKNKSRRICSKSQTIPFNGNKNQKFNEKRMATSTSCNFRNRI